jgi:Domain of unknown function (DUF5753)
MEANGAVMHDRLVRLRNAAGQPGISVGISPFTAGAHPSMTEPFTILYSDAWDEDVLFREAATRTVTNREDRDLVADYRARFDLLCGMLLEEDQASALLDALIKGLQDAAQAKQPD